MKSIMFFILSGQVVLNLITKGFKTFQKECDLKIETAKIVASNAILRHIVEETKASDDDLL